MARGKGAGPGRPEGTGKFDQPPTTVRLGDEETRAIQVLGARWGLRKKGDIIRKALRESAGISEAAAER